MCVGIYYYSIDIHIIYYPSKRFLFSTPTLFLTGALAIQSKNVHILHETLLKTKPADQKVKYELVQIDGVANVLTEAVN